MGEKEVLVDQGDPALAGLPEPGEPVFYPKVGHCVYRGLTEDRAAPGKKLVELEDLEEGSRILIPTERVPKLGLRPAGRELEQIQAELSAEFEQPLEQDQELEGLIESLVSEGSPRALAKGLKRLHLLRQTGGLSREDEQTRRKIRSWLAAEVALSKDCTRAEAQALITRILQEAMNAHRRKEREEAKERRRQVKAQKAAEDAAALREEEEEGSLAAAEGASEHVAVTAPEPTQTPPPSEQENKDEIGDVGATDAIEPAAPEGAKGAAPQAAEESPEPTTPEPPATSAKATEEAPQTNEVEAAPNSPSTQDPSTSDQSPPSVTEAKSDEAPATTPKPGRDLSPELNDDSTEGESSSPKPS